MLEFRRTNLNKRHDLQETSNFWELLSFKMIYPAPEAASQWGDITVSDPDFRGKDDEDEADPNPNHTHAGLSEAW